jgi:hypothetical protein
MSSASTGEKKARRRSIDGPPGFFSCFVLSSLIKTFLYMNATDILDESTLLFFLL